jgi:DNA-binding transcriptional LysR family regulator
MNNHDFDLNLLRVFDAVLESRSVSVAARQLSLSQPAVSHALNRLRAAVDDVLFVRAKDGLVPTARAQVLAPHITQVLQHAAKVLHPVEPASPLTARRTFHVAMADLSVETILPGLMQRLESQAPNIQVVCHPSASGASGPLENGTLDLLVGPKPLRMPQVYVRALHSEVFVSAIRRTHPLAGKRVSLKAFAALRHIQIAPGLTPGGQLDDALLRRGFHRRVAVRLPHFLVAPRLVEASDMVLTAPSRLLQRYQDSHGLFLFVPPVPLKGFTLVQAWHARMHQDPLHQWFREQVYQAAAAKEPAPSRLGPDGSGEAPSVPRKA